MGKFMFDNTQIVHTQELAEAIRSLAGLFVKEEQLNKVEVVDRKGIKHYLAPGIITGIMSTVFYNPERSAAAVYYANGERFELDIETHDLANQLNIVESEK